MNPAAARTGRFARKKGFSSALAGLVTFVLFVFALAGDAWALRMAIPLQPVSLVTATPHVGRWMHQSVLLDNGKVLSAGGWLAGGIPAATNTAELFDPIAQTWTLTGSMNIGRTGFAMVKLPNGNVLAAGGNPSHPQAEVYDVATGTWSLTLNSPPIRGNSPTATLMNDGKVLLVGGFDYSAVNGMAPQAWKYDPATNSWSPDANLVFSRSGHRANLLSGGELLVTGGSRNGIHYEALDFSELYSSGHFGDGGPLSEGRMGHTATSLSNGDVLVVGGSGFYGGSFHPATTAEIRSPGGWWRTLPPSVPHAGGHTANRLWNGWVAVIGGNHDGTTPTTYIELYDPTNRTWMPTASLVYPRQSHTATTLLDGRVLVDGGNFWTTIPSEIFIFP